MTYYEVKDMGPIAEEYSLFQIDINYAINNLGTVNLDIYVDASGTTFALDSSGNMISDRQIIRMEYTYARIDPDTLLPIDGAFIITFSEGSTWQQVDLQHGLYWYRVEGLDPPEIKLFT
jgi:hypothetical protein